MTSGYFKMTNGKTDKIKLTQSKKKPTDSYSYYQIYSYADIAYVGGGFGNPGVHNILEPATFGVPIVIGPNYSHFEEATSLVQLGSCISISNQQELEQALTDLIQNNDTRDHKGQICNAFVQKNKGATNRIMTKISTL